MNNETIVKVVTIIVLGVNLLATIIVIGFVSVLTDRNMRPVEFMALVGAGFIAGLGGINWALLRRHRHWRVNLERENGSSHDDTVS